MKLTIVNEGQGLLTIGKDGKYFNHIECADLQNNIHAVQWDGTSGQVEYKDASTGEMTGNQSINDISGFQFAVDAWQTAYEAEQAAIAHAIALEEAKIAASRAAYAEAIANGASEEEAQAAGQSAYDAVSSI